MKLTWVVSTIIKKGYRFIKTRMTAGIVENSYSSMPFGFDSNPSKNFIAIVSETQSNDKPVIIGYLNPGALSDLGIGDSMQYATDVNGEYISTLKLRSDGTMELLGNSDNAVRYSKLKEEYDKTRSVLDAILTTLETPINEPGNGAPSAFQAAMILAVGEKETGDISGSKINEIKVP